MMTYRAFAFVLAVSAGCATEPSSDELNIEVGEQQLSVSRGDDHATLAWTETAATLETNGELATVLRADASGTWAPVATSSAFERAARLVAEADTTLGIELPWRTVADHLSAAGCTTVSTWVRGGAGSCTDCRAVAWNEAGGPQGDHAGGSCSQGSLWTTCSHTWCDSGDQAFATEAALLQ